MRGETIPSIDPGELGYLLDALTEAGLHGHVGLGDPVPLTWTELWAFGQATEAITEAWEYETLAAMSRAYVDGLVRGRDGLPLPSGDEHG